MKLPEDLRYTRTHSWIRKLSDGTLQVGITDHAQETLGDMVFVEAPKRDKQLTREDACGVVESVKTASDIYAPVSGVVIEVNEELQKHPEKINESAYGSWIYQLRPIDQNEFDELLDAAQYRSYIENA